MFSRAGRIFSTHPGLFFFNFLEIALIAWWLARGSWSTEDWFVDNECQTPEWQDTVWDGYDDAIKAVRPTPHPHDTNHYTLEKKRKTDN
jgi:hypothetical protein